MTTKEINVDELLNSHDAGRPAKSNKDTKKSKYDDDWEENDDTNGFGGFTTVTKTTKSKAKKKVADKGWADDAETKPAAPVVDESKVQQPQPEAPRKGIFKKPTGETAASKPKVNLEEELFPTLGEDAPKTVPKKKVEPVTPPQTDSKAAPSSGPKRFVNAAKKGAGENFVPLDPTLVEKLPEIVAKPETEKTEKIEKADKIEKAEKTEKTDKPERAEGFKPVAPRGFFSRNDKTVTELEANAAVAEAQEESKFKFGSGEGPKKFTAGNKISFKREEEKSEQEALRLQKEREIEEKLQKERDEAAKARESRKPREHKDGEKPTERPEKTEGQEEKRSTKFINSKKDTEKTAPRKISTEKPIEEPKEEKIVPAKEVIEVHGSLSTKGWGEGGDIRKKATATTAAKK